MGWSTSKPSGYTWGSWSEMKVCVNVNNYANYGMDAAVGRGSGNNLAVAIRLYVYARNVGDTAYIDLAGNVKVGSGSWNSSTAVTCSGGFGAYNYSRTIYYTTTANTGLTIYVNCDWNGNNTANVSFASPAYTTTYTISYNANGGSGAPNAQTKKYNTTLTLSTTKPTKTGYTFKGWATSSSATTAQYQPGGSYTANASATLWAVWQIITYTITYKSNYSGGPSDVTQSKNYGSAVTLKGASTFTRTNYTFLYWYTNSSGTGGTQYNAGASYNTNKDLTLYAIWKKNNIPVFINVGGEIKQVEKAYINIGGEIKEATVYLNVSGNIKTIV